MSETALWYPSVSRRVAQAVAEVGAGILPIFFFLYALLASGCSSPTATPAPKLQGVLTQRASHAPSPQALGNGQGAFSAVLFQEDATLPPLAGTSASYSVSVDGVAHALASGIAVGAQLSDDVGNPWYVFMLTASATAPAESVQLAVDAAHYVPGTVALDGVVAFAVLVDAYGEPLAYTTGGTLTLGAAPTAIGALAQGSFDATFAAVPQNPGCVTDRDCAAGERCVRGVCEAAGCSLTGCPAGLVCDPSSGACLPAGCATDADCAVGQACRAGQCVAAGCALTGCPAGLACDPSSGQCLPIGCPAGLVDCAGACIDLFNDPAHCGACGVQCAAGQACTFGACQPTGCQATGCPAGTFCDATIGVCVPVPAGCRTDSECNRGEMCQGGRCVPAGCVQYGCPAGYTCDVASGACVRGSTSVGNCVSQGAAVGSGSFTGQAGGVAMCSAAGLDAVSGGPDAALFDSQDELGDPATLLVVGDLADVGGTMLVAVLDRCPAAGETLLAPSTRILLITETVTADTELYVQKTASGGSVTFTAQPGGGLGATLTATFGGQTVTATASHLQ